MQQLTADISNLYVHLETMPSQVTIALITPRCAPAIAHNENA